MPDIVVLSDGCSPTEDIYLMRSCASQLSVRQQLSFRTIKCKRQKPEHRLFTQSDILIVFRTLPANWIQYLEKHKRAKRLIYVLDDDLRAAEATAELPEDYRSKIAGFANHHLDQLLNMADTLVVTSAHLIETYSESNPVRLNPTALSLPKQISNFDRPTTSIAYHATSSHKADLKHIEESLINTLNNFNCSFESLIGKQTPDRLKQHSAVKCKSPKTYASFRRFQSLAKRNICLAPLIETPYNKGKSWIKFLDASAVGAVGVYSNRAPYTEIVQHGINGMLASDDASDWESCLSYLLENPEKAQIMAENALKTARSIGSFKWSYRFWVKQFSS